MPTPAALKTKLDAVLRKFAPPERTVYKRVVTRTGGDDLIGRPGTVTNTDTLLNPQPLYQRVGDVGDGRSTPVMAGATPVGAMVEDYQLLASGSAVSASDLASKDVLFVFKTTTGAEEVYRIMDWEPVGFSGTDVLYVITIRSTKR